MMELNEPVEFNDFINPICMPRSNVSVESIEGTVVGYGISEKNDGHETIPRFVELRTVTQEECYRNHNLFSSMISSNTFCGGGKGKSPCRGKKVQEFKAFFSFHILSL